MIITNNWRIASLLIASLICAHLSVSTTWSMDQFSWGVSGRQGKRGHFEDRYTASTDQHNVFGIFDGHGGTRAAQYVSDNISKTLDAELKRTNNVPKALENAFLTLDNYLIRKKRKSGTTAVLAYKNKKNNKLYLAWAGDSRGMVINDNTITKTKDHKPDTEKKRIQEAIVELNKQNNQQQTISYEDAIKNNRAFGLAMSRSLGDNRHKNKGRGIIIATPDIKTIDKLKKGAIILLASDGFWDVIGKEAYVQQLVNLALDRTQDVHSADDIKEILKRAGLNADSFSSKEEHIENGNEQKEAGNKEQATRLQLIARALVNKAYAKGSGDNIEVLLAQFNG